MIQALLERRQLAMERAQRARNSIDGKEAYLSELESVVTELSEIAESLKSQDGHRIELSRTYENIGTVHLKMEPEICDEALSLAKKAFELAEGFLDGDEDTIYRAGLDYIIANTLIQNPKRDLDVLVEVWQRFTRARNVFVNSDDERESKAQQALQNIEAMLPSVLALKGLEPELPEVRPLEQQIFHGGSIAAGEMRPFLLQAIKNSGGNKAVLDEVGKFVYRLPKELRESLGFRGLIDKLKRILPTGQKMWLPAAIKESRDQRKAEFAGLSAEELALRAVDSSSGFKLIGSRLESMKPSREAARILVEGFVTNQAKGWLVADLLGCIGHREGYDTANHILLAGLGQSSESYAGVALAQIAGDDAFYDLKHAINEGSTRRVREGAAYGLARLGSKEAMEVLFQATLAGKIPTLKGGIILGSDFEFPDHMIVELFSTGPKGVRLATEILWARVFTSPIDQKGERRPLEKPSSDIAACLRGILSNSDFKMRPYKRRCLKAWLAMAG